MVREDDFLVAFAGYGSAGVLGYIIYKLNEIFFPEYATPARLLLWTLLMGTFLTILLSKKRERK